MSDSKTTSPSNVVRSFLGVQVQELEEELVAAKNAAAQVSREHASVVASLKSEIAALAASKAQEDASTVRALKQYHDAERHLQTRLSEAETSYRSFEARLATAMAEKEELIAENEELRSVCEEALSVAETTHSASQH